MLGIWLLTAFKNYERFGKQENYKNEVPQEPASTQAVPKWLKTANLVEIGPGTGRMMCDVLRTLSQFSGGLKNVHVNLIESSANLRKVQQERLLKHIQEDLKIFLSYDMGKKK